MRCVRIWFEKTGNVRYISHLDLMRTVTRAVRRSKIPLWYTEGFNPKPYMTFALPLSLGMKSECESMDIKIEGEISNDEISASLKSVMPDGLIITGVTDPVLDPKLIALGEFSVEFFGTYEKENLASTIEAMLNGESLIVQKLGKKGHKKVFKDIDLLKYIREYEITENGQRLIFRLLLPAGSAENINPALLCDEIIKSFGGDVYYIITRKKLLTADGKAFC